MPVKLKLLLPLLFAFVYVDAQITISMRKSFIDSLKSRLTIDANYEIWYAHAHANPASKDGDLHFAGWDKKNWIAGGSGGDECEGSNRCGKPDT